MKDAYIQWCEDGKQNIGGLLYTMEFGENSHIISHVWTNGKDGHRGHGHADQLMSQVTKDADEHGKRLYLQVGDGNADVDPDRLSGLYKRHGFDWDDEIGGEAERAMSRDPRTTRTAAASTPGQRGAEEFLRAVQPGDLDRLTDAHVPDEWDYNFGVSTDGGGSRQVQESYPEEGHYNRVFHPDSHLSEPAPVEERSPLWDRDHWDSALGEVGFHYKEHPNPTVSGFYWKPDQPRNASSLGYRIEHPSPWEPYWKAHYGQGHRDGGASIAMSRELPSIIEAVDQHRNSLPHRTSAAAKKPKPPRKPEEAWYDVHKHPEGVPGGMGKSPEHHLKNRGWKGHEINEGSGKKTIQYRHQDYPNFVISYGGGSGTKPDHNFRILHMGINSNVPKVTRAYSVAEAMNKVEELHGLNNGLVVQPMTYGAAVEWRDMTDHDHHPIGAPDPEFPTKPDAESDWVKPKAPLKPKPSKAKKPPSVVAAVLRTAQAETWEEA